jgi:hypothetical protein
LLWLLSILSSFQDLCNRITSTEDQWFDWFGNGIWHVNCTGTTRCECVTEVGPFIWGI